MLAERGIRPVLAGADRAPRLGDAPSRRAGAAGLNEQDPCGSGAPHVLLGPTRAFDIMYAEGISHTSLLVDIGAESNIIEKSGAWYSYKGQKIGQGRENAKMYLKDNPAIMAEIEEQVKGVLGINADQQPGTVEPDETE
jgi:hypothetical protein